MRRAGGFSLVELMIAMTVGLGLIAAVTGLFAATSGGRSELEKTARMFDNGRHAQDLLAEDVRLAGYFGELPLADYRTVVPDPCRVDATALGWQPAVLPAVATVPAAVVGYRDETGVPACLPDRLAGTDVVVIRRVATAPTPLAAIEAGIAYLQTSRCVDDTAPFALETTAAALTLRSFDCATRLAPRRLVVRLYYVSRCNDCARDATPTLKRVEPRGASLTVVPLVEGIEDMRLDYGFDVDGDGVADRFLRSTSGVPGDADDDWGNVVAVRLHLLARTVERAVGPVDDARFAMGLAGPVGPFPDGWKRTVFASAVRLANPAGRRE